MTYVKFEHEHADDPRWLEAGADALALHLCALLWCDRMLTDGAVPAAMAVRVSLAVPPDRAVEAVAALVARGFWSEDGDGGYQIERYLEHALSAEMILRTRGKWKGDKLRRNQHSLGDHALCKDPQHCPAIASKHRAGDHELCHPEYCGENAGTVESTVDSTTASTSGSTGGGSRLYQTRPDQTRPDRREGSGNGMGGGDSAPSAPSAPRRVAASAAPPAGQGQGEPWRPPGSLPPGVIPQVDGVPIGPDWKPNGGKLR